MKVGKELGTQVIVLELEGTEVAFLYLFAPVISVNSWLSLVSQGVKPMMSMIEQKG